MPVFLAADHPLNVIHSVAQHSAPADRRAVRPDLRMRRQALSPRHRPGDSTENRTLPRSESRLMENGNGLEINFPAMQVHQRHTDTQIEWGADHNRCAVARIEHSK